MNKEEIVRMERLRHRIIIYCNKCYRPLTEKESNHYSIEHQFSGEMYCDEHRIDEEFIAKHRD